MTARLLEQKCGAACSTTMIQASHRIGGKLHTRRFSKADAAYESGVAECYGYANGDDPLRSLVADLGLATVDTAGSTVVMDGQIIRDDEDLARAGGPSTRAAVQSFRDISAQALSVGEWRGRSPEDNPPHPSEALSGADLLELVDDDLARRYLALLAHSDLATQRHQTSALYALRKMVMELPGYGSVYALEGGMEELPRRIAQQLTRTRIELNARLVRIARQAEGGYPLTVSRGRELYWRRLTSSSWRCRTARCTRSNAQATGCAIISLRNRPLRSTRPLPPRLAAVRSLLAQGIPAHGSYSTRSAAVASMTRAPSSGPSAASSVG